LAAGWRSSAGLLVPLAAAGLVAQSIVLTWRIHWPNRFWSAKGGIEFPLGFMAGAFAIQVLGPGAWSLDAFLPVDVLYELAVRWVILGLAVAGALLAIVLSTSPRSQPAEQAGEPGGESA